MASKVITDPATQVEFQVVNDALEAAVALWNETRAVSVEKGLGKGRVSDSPKETTGAVPAGAQPIVNYLDATPLSAGSRSRPAGSRDADRIPQRRVGAPGRQEARGWFDIGLTGSAGGVNSPRIKPTP